MNTLLPVGEEVNLCHSITESFLVTLDLTVEYI